MRPCAIIVHQLDGPDLIDAVPDVDLPLDVYLSPNNLVDLAARLTVHGRAELLHHLGAHDDGRPYAHCELCRADVTEGRRSLDAPEPAPFDPDAALQALVDTWGALGVAIKLLAGIPADGRDEWLQHLASGDYMGAPMMLGWQPPEPDGAPERGLPDLPVHVAAVLALVAFHRVSAPSVGTMEQLVHRVWMELVKARCNVSAPWVEDDVAELLRAVLGR